MTFDRVAAASKALERLLEMKGEFVWAVHLSGGNVLRMNFGAPHLKIREPNPNVSGKSQAVIDALGRRMVIPKGIWHLFIYDGEWSVTTKYYACSRSDTDPEKLNEPLRQLDGQKLINVIRRNEENDWIFEFDLGGILRIYPSKESGEDWSDEHQWILFHEDGNNVSYKNDGCFE